MTTPGFCSVCPFLGTARPFEPVADFWIQRDTSRRFTFSRRRQRKLARMCNFDTECRIYTTFLHDIV